MIALVQIIRTLEDKMAKTIGIPVKGFQFDASGKLKKKPPRMSVSKRIAASKSKRVRPTKRVKGMINKP